VRRYHGVDAVLAEDAEGDRQVGGVGAVELVSTFSVTMHTRDDEAVLAGAVRPIEQEGPVVDDLGRRRRVLEVSGRLPW
jgi:hypothetical protein